MSNNRSPKISIITVVKDGEDCIENTIKSVIGQTYSNTEYIIVYSASRDATKSIIDNFTNKISKTIFSKDEGIYGAMNIGIDAASGDYLNFLNCGDYYNEKDTLEKIFNGRNCSSEDIIYGNISLVNDFGRKVKNVKALDFTAKNLRKNGTRTLCHQATFVKRNIANHYDTSYKILSDFNWYFDLIDKNPTICHIDRSLVCYRIGGYSSRRFLQSNVEQALIIYRRFGSISLLRFFPYLIKPIAYRLLSSLHRKKYPV